MCGVRMAGRVKQGHRTSWERCSFARLAQCGLAQLLLRQSSTSGFRGQHHAIQFRCAPQRGCKLSASVGPARDGPWRMPKSDCHLEMHVKSARRRPERRGREIGPRRPSTDNTADTLGMASTSVEDGAEMSMESAHACRRTSTEASPRTARASTVRVPSFPRVPKPANPSRIARHGSGCCHALLESRRSGSARRKLCTRHSSWKPKPVRWESGNAWGAVGPAAEAAAR